MSDVKELEPCPFCGGEATLREVQSPVWPTGWRTAGWKPSCGSCGAEINDRPEKDEAAEAWNGRAALSGTREAVEPVARSRVDWPAEITNCPFCNAANVYLCKPWKDARHRVECNMCRASGPVKTSAQSAVDAWAFFAPAAPPSDPVGQGAVTVKPLEWDDDGNWWGLYARKSEVGCYNVAQCRNEPNGDGVRNTNWFVKYPNTEAMTFHPNEVEAKAAAQADYERRILSAFSPAPEAGNDEVERLRARVAELEAAKWDVRHIDTINDMAAMGMARDAAQAEVTALRDQLGKMREALAALLDAETVSVHVGYDNGPGGGNFLYADAIRTDDPAFLLARATLAETQEAG